MIPGASPNDRPRPGARAVGHVALLLLAACITGPPRIDGAPGAPPHPGSYWTPPRDAVPARVSEPEGAPPGAFTAAALQRLTLADVVDLALRNNPVTRISWAQARSAADLYGASYGRWYPTITADMNATRSLSLALPGRLPGERTQYGPSVTLSFLALDFGGRAAAVDAARATAVAADLAHNGTVQNTILQVETALFGYLATRAQRDAQRTSLAEAGTSLEAAEARHGVGLATIADVLQARTARSQAELQLETLEGSLQIARGSLAVAMGLPANTSYDVPDVPPVDSVRDITVSVDTLIAQAARTRPDLAAARAQAEAAAADVRVTRAAGYPALTLGTTGGYTNSDVSAFSGRTYAVTLGLNLPLFTGFAQTYSVQSAAEQSEAAAARATSLRQQIAFQVFSAYYGLRTASQRVRTSGELLASALESERVARGRYQEGVGSIVDLLVAQSALATARAQEVQARWDWRTALAQLAHDVGALGIHGEPLVPLGAASTSRGR